MTLQYHCPLCETSGPGFHARVKGYDFHKCGNCEFVFSPQITDEYLSRLYEEGFHGTEEGAPVKGWTKNIDFLFPALDLLEDRKDLSVLDFGTGQSRVPEMLRQIGHRTTAVDIVPPLRPHPDRLTGDLLQLRLPENSFELSFSFQVFEHLPRPRPVPDELLRLTKPGGLVLIHTDMETPERDSEGFENWWYMQPPDHCVFYRNKSFAAWAENTPHQIIFEDPKTVIIQKNS